MILGYHQFGGELPVTTQTVTTLTDTFIQAGRELGYSKIDYNGEHMLGLYVYMHNDYLKYI